MKGGFQDCTLVNERRFARLHVRNEGLAADDLPPFFQIDRLNLRAILDGLKHTPQTSSNIRKEILQHNYERAREGVGEFRSKAQQ